ncbi:Hypothetical protein FKW44_009414 [Caligus rogercresseyi]|uniref:Uncharacterized protein n=1 Tax=Caligus rogercresseyi TaxID=217165 RepID=A0A7T8HF99_CALRO|nr:Hypothetical protein FKW44_009414 [Caligus rogercresseyi]
MYELVSIYYELCLITKDWKCPWNLSAGRPLLWRSVAAVRPRKSRLLQIPPATVYSIAKSFKESEDIEEGFPNTGKKDSRPSPSQEEERRFH